MHMVLVSSATRDFLLHRRLESAKAGHVLLLLLLLQLLLLLMLLLVAKHDDWLLEEHRHLLYAAAAGLLRWNSKLAGLAALPRLALHPLHIECG